MDTINKKLDRLKELFQDPDFYTGKGLSNEVNIRIFCYDPKDEMIVRESTRKLLKDHSILGNIIHYNLYEIFLEICNDRKLLDRIPLMEEQRGSEFLKSRIDIFSTTKAFAEKMDHGEIKRGKDVLLLSGVGEVYPFMRVHSLLSELQVHFDEIPIVVLYPGEFNGRTVRLFNEFKENEYYRAFNLV